jgi:hypothetical protein
MKMHDGNTDSQIPEFDPSTLLDHPALVGQLTTRETNTYSDDEEALEDAIRESPIVLTVSWSADSPAGSGSLCVHRWKGLYFLDSLDWGLEGPATSLEQILADERLCEPCPSPEITSGELPLQSLLQIAAKLASDEEPSIQVNSQVFQRDSQGNFVQA